MDIEASKIPNVQLVKTGSKKNPGYTVEGWIDLHAWTGYYLYDDSYKLKKDKVVTNGSIRLSFDSTGDLAQEQVDCYYYLVEHEETIKRSILQALKQAFPRLLSTEYESWDHDDGSLPRLADLTPAFDFKNHIGPETISIGEIDKDGMAYVTWYFRAAWDPEHGMQVITHKDRVIDIGPETDIWNIYKDKGTYEQELEDYNKRVWTKVPPKKKKWWQFW